ncbi:MAG: preprotein translocase subunit SecA, partial [Pseudomonadota bacterium]|nr:preprotein translocase subunit SecA [Pseudomonadota bacterium]
VGTSSLESSEIVSQLLKNKQIEHQILNAKNHAKEAEVIAQAGRPKVVTIATNMAGRGTDIVLGGNWEAEIEQQNITDENLKERLHAEWKERNKEVLNAGGLHVIGTERNESRRIDNQLRGRSGRQGDAGSSRFYISLEDNLMRIFASERFKAIMQNLGLENGEAIEHKMLSGAIQRAQKRVEGRNFDLRKLLLEYDDMANEQRQVIYSQRDTILYSEDITELLDSMRETVIENQVRTYIPEDAPEQQWDLDGLEKSVIHDFGIQIPIKKWVEEDTDLQEEELIKKMLLATSSQYKTKCEPIGPAMRDFEKQILLQVIDNAWKEHLGAVEYLRQGIGLRGYASKNPKLEFRRESFELFEDLLNKIRVEAIRFLSRVEIEFDSPDDLIKNQKANKEQVYEHQEAKSYPAHQDDKPITNQEREETPVQGNRRLRRYEAKMARKRKLKD